LCARNIDIYKILVRYRRRCFCQRASAGAALDDADDLTGTLVKKVQAKLKELGFDPGPKDGKLGPMTEAVVIAFQLYESLVVDGEVGPETAEALEIGL